MLKRFLSSSALFAAVVVSSTAFAGTIPVTVGTDTSNPGECSLRDALAAARTGVAVNACVPGSAPFVISLGAGAYGLQSQLALDVSVTIRGAGAGAPAIIDAGGVDRFGTVGMGAEVRLEDLMIANGRANDDGFGQTRGGALMVFGGVTLERVILTANTANRGGAIYLLGGSANATVLDSEISLNTASLIGGAIENSDGNLTVRRSLIVGNTGNVTGAISSGGVTTIINSTIAGNTGTTGPGAAIFVAAGTLALLSSTVVNNTGDAAVYDNGVVGTRIKNSVVEFTGGCSSGLTSDGSNVFVGECVTAAMGDVFVTSTGLSALADNGGPTRTLAVGATGPARGTGTCSDLMGMPIMDDQRGGSRPTSGCDRGAFQTGAFPTVQRISVLPAGDMACPTGGEAITYGEDSGAGAGEQNGLLDDPEIQGSVNLCNAVNTLVRVTDEQAGPNCANGGQAIATGRDLDGNGTLADSEVQTTRYVCNGPAGTDGSDGEDGRESLVVLTQLSVGDTQCAAGGQRIDTGIDDDGNGTLAQSEIDRTAYACNGTPGADGMDGTDGTNGSNGTNGTNGKDGSGGCSASDIPGSGVPWAVALLVLAGLRRKR